MEEFEAFRRGIRGDDVIAGLRAGLIGKGVRIETPFGRPELLYADYVASGRALSQIETFVAERVLPYHANTHTEASFCGAKMSALREAARQTIFRLTGCDPDCHVVFAGSGATAGINRIVRLLDIERTVAGGGRVSVITGPYEHHSNLLPWREAGARVVETPEAVDGGPDLDALDRLVESCCGDGSERQRRRARRARRATERRRPASRDFACSSERDRVKRDRLARRR